MPFWRGQFDVDVFCSQRSQVRPSEQIYLDSNRSLSHRRTKHCCILQYVNNVNPHSGNTFIFTPFGKTSKTTRYIQVSDINLYSFYILFNFSNI